MKKDNEIKVFLEPNINLPYASFYIMGFNDVLGNKNIIISKEVLFKSLNKRNDDYSFDAYMALIVKSKEDRFKVIIDFGDDTPIRNNAYQWCDLYAKINYNPKLTHEKFKDKVYSIPPSFNIKCWKWHEVISYSFSNLIKTRFKPQVSLIKHFRLYFSQFKSLNIKMFENNSNKYTGNYVFFISSLWEHDNCLIGTNLYRKMFMETILRSDCNFEGGFYLNTKNHPQESEVKHLSFSKRYSLKKFVKNTKKSNVVFNTPSVHNCHGWKLAQYLAMGKAIISTQLFNELPEKLTHLQNVYFVENENDMKEGVKVILTDNTLRKNLEVGAKNYYEKHVSPKAVIQNIFAELFKEKVE